MRAQPLGSSVSTVRLTNLLAVELDGPGTCAMLDAQSRTPNSLRPGTRMGIMIT